MKRRPQPRLGKSLFVILSLLYFFEWHHPLDRRRAAVILLCLALKSQEQHWGMDGTKAQTKREEDMIDVHA